ncbi:MAG TPA: ester cyclase [Ktedonobacteraceae bacterium]
MDSEANKALVSRYVELWNTGNLALADEVLAADFVDHAHPEFTPGADSVKQAVIDFRIGFPDAHVTIEHMMSEGDMVAMHNVIRGTHLGVFAGFPPTGKEMVLRGMGFIRIANWKMVELWNCQDTLNWALQFGAKLSFPAQ